MAAILHILHHTRCDTAQEQDQSTLSCCKKTAVLPGPAAEACVPMRSNQEQEHKHASKCSQGKGSRVDFCILRYQLLEASLCNASLQASIAGSDLSQLDLALAPAPGVWPCAHFRFAAQQ